MPFQSKAQRAYLFANKPEVAKVFAKHTKKSAKLPEKKNVKSSKTKNRKRKR